MEVSSAYNVIRNNHFHNEEWMSGVPHDGLGSAGVSLRSQQNIVRRNIFYDADTAGLNISSPGYHVTTYDPPGDVRYNRANDARPPATGRRSKGAANLSYPQPR